jgi:uncharacterized protein
MSWGWCEKRNLLSLIAYANHVFALHLPEFEWDNSNLIKLEKHAVNVAEAESVWKDFEALTELIINPLYNEQRLCRIGYSNLGRILFIIYTERHGKIRIISARTANKKTERPRRDSETDQHV